MSRSPYYCEHCGAYVPDRSKKCLACGFPVNEPLRVSCQNAEPDYSRVAEHSISESLPMTPLNDNTINTQVAHGDSKVIPKEFRVELEPCKEPNLDGLDDWAKKIVDVNPFDDFYGMFYILADETRKNIAANKAKERADKPDIDLDDLMEKTFVTIKINDKVSRFYYGARPQMCVADTEILGRTMNGRIIGKGIKRKIDFRLIEA